MHNPQNNAKPKEKPGNANKTKPRETASLFGTSVEENYKDKKKGNWKGRGNNGRNVSDWNRCATGGVLELCGKFMRFWLPTEP